MDNQHRLIQTYRELSAEEISNINASKALEARVLEMQKLILDKATTDLHNAQVSMDTVGASGDVYANIESARRAVRCASIAKTELQTGFMWLVLAIARPGEPEFDKTEVPNGQEEN